MKKIALGVLAFVLILSGATWAQQSGDREKNFSMHGTMQQMMKGEKSSEGGMGGVRGMGDMTGMKGQMPQTMEQCAAMMSSTETATQKAK